MSRRSRTTCLLVTVLGIMSPSIMAWTPYGYGPYGPGYQGSYPGTTQQGPRPEATSDELGPPQSSDPSYGYDGEPAVPFRGERQWIPYGQFPPGGYYQPPAQGHPGYGPQFGPSWGPPDLGGQGFAAPARLRITRESSVDAYSLTVALDGMTPEEVQVRAQGQSLLISSERSEEQVRKDSFDDDRGFLRSFSYSSGTTSRRLSVPPDGDLSAMSREDGESSIRIRIPRRGR